MLVMSHREGEVLEIGPDIPDLHQARQGTLGSPGYRGTPGCGAQPSPRFARGWRDL